MRSIRVDNRCTCIPAGWRYRADVGDLEREFVFSTDVALGDFAGEVVEAFQHGARDLRPVFDWKSGMRGGVILRFGPPVGPAQLEATRRISELPTARHAHSLEAVVEDDA